MDLEALRADIPACESCAFLNTGASGPSPRRVVEAVADAQRSHEFDVCSIGHYEAADELRETARTALAGYLGCSPSDVALAASTGDGISRVANALDWAAGDRVVRTDLEHPSGVLPWRRLRDDGVEVETLACPDGRLPMDDYHDAVVDAKLVCLSSESWLHGTRLPVREAVEIAHDAGAIVLIDAVQTVGQHPIDVTEWGADVVTASGHKWLLGPWGTGFLYVDPDTVSRFRPRHLGYRSAVDPTGDGLEFHPDARRFEVSTSALAPYAGVVEALELVDEIGIDTIERRIRRLTDRLKDGLGDRCLSPTEFESGLVAIEVDDAETAVDQLADDGVIVRDLPNGSLRASVHAFNTAEEIDTLLGSLPP